MSRTTGVAHRFRAARLPMRHSRQWAIPVWATVLILSPAIVAPVAAGEIADDTLAPGFAARFGETAGSWYTDAERHVIAPARQAVTGLLSDPLALALRNRLSGAAQGLASVTQGFIIEPAVRESAALTQSAAEALRRYLVTSGTASAESGRQSGDPAGFWLATRADMAQQAMSLPDLSDRDALRSLAEDDPLEPLNRLVFALNRQFQAYILDPLSGVYLDRMPAGARSSLRNFFHNLREPATLVTSALEGELHDAGIAGARFGINSTLGVAGFFDPATEMGLTVRPRNLEDALCRYGLPPGPYLVLPVLGPATVRDAAGRLATVVMYFEVMGVSVYLPYRITDIAVQYTEAKTKQSLIDSLASDPYVAQKIFYRAATSLGCAGR
jgi:phospholipid-binding lipoprotein MlaA